MPRCPRSRPAQVRRATLAAGLVLTALLTACRTTVTVDIDGNTSGGGVVTVSVDLDAEAVTLLGGADRIALDDLADTGWTVEGPTTGEKGTVILSASHPYTDGDDLAAVLTEVGGESIVGEVHSDASDSFGRTSYDLSVAVAVTGDPAQFSDDALTTLLGGLPLGRTPEELANEGITEPGAGKLVVNLSVPGGGSDIAEVDLTSGEPQSVEASADSTVVQPVVLGLAIAAAVLLVAGLVLVVIGLVRRRHS